jgi:hypothetical protein
MVDTSIKFLSFDEAVEAAKNEPGVEFIGLRYIAPFSRLDVYVIHVDPDEIGYVNVQYEGGDLFDLGGEEEFYGLDDVPKEAKGLFYARKADLGNGDGQVMGMTSEFVLQEVLPGLSKDAKYRDQAHFVQVAGAEFRAFWRQQ